MNPTDTQSSHTPYVVDRFLLRDTFIIRSGLNGEYNRALIEDEIPEHLRGWLVRRYGLEFIAEFACEAHAETVAMALMVLNA